MIERWIPFWDGKYEVSNLGRVRRIAPGKRTQVGRILKPTLMRTGYFSVAPVLSGKNRRVHIHELVAEAFLGARPDAHEVNHIDGCKTNNAVSNLEYVTHAQNMAHAGSVGLSARGERHGASKLTDDDVRDIRRMRARGIPLGAVCEKFAIGKSTASQIANGKRWRHVS